MKKWDEVKLNKEIDELALNGIHKGYSGTVIESNAENSLIWFSNPKNYGEFAFAKVENKYLDMAEPVHYNKKILCEMEEFLESVNMEKYTSLSECDVKEYDVVELIVEKPEYAMEGVHKGDRGCVISTYAIDNCWEIIFSERGTGRDIAQIGVAREDFKIIDKF